LEPSHYVDCIYVREIFRELDRIHPDSRDGILAHGEPQESYL